MTFIKDQAHRDLIDPPPRHMTENISALARLLRERAGGWPVAVRAADALRDAEARIKELEKENFALAACQCSEPYGDDYGNARCRIADRADASEARAVAAETKLVQAAGVLKWLDRKGGLGLDVHDYIKSLIIQLT